MESGGYGGGERVTAMDHQDYQESHRTRGNDEALERKRIGASVPRCWHANTFLRSLYLAAGPSDVSVTY